MEKGHLPWSDFMVRGVNGPSVTRQLRFESLRPRSFLTRRLSTLGVGL